MDAEGMVDLLERDVVDRSERKDAGVVDQDVEPAEFVDSLSDGLHYVIGGHVVGPDRQPAPAVRGDLGDHLFGALL
jgi:hypothetical protein